MLVNVGSMVCADFERIPDSTLDRSCVAEVHQPRCSCTGRDDIEAEKWQQCPWEEWRDALLARLKPLVDSALADLVARKDALTKEVMEALDKEPEYVPGKGKRKKKNPKIKKIMEAKARKQAPLQREQELLDLLSALPSSGMNNAQ